MWNEQYNEQHNNVFYQIIKEDTSRVRSGIQLAYNSS